MRSRYIVKTLFLSLNVLLAYSVCAARSTNAVVAPDRQIATNGLVSAEAGAKKVDPSRVGPPMGSPWTVGCFVLAKTQRYHGAGTRVAAFPAVTYASRRLLLMGPTARLRLWQGVRWSGWTTLNWRFDGYHANDGARLAGLPDRRDTLEGGLRLSLATMPGTMLNMQVSQDLMQRHGGQRIESDLSYRHHLGRGRMASATMGLIWLSSGAADYYYGVEPEFATKERPAYRCGHSAFTAQAGVSLALPVTQNWRILGAFLLEADSSAITDSPIVEGWLQRSMVFSLTRSL